MPLHTIHRPKKLEDIVGNESVVESLKSVLSREKDIPHCYMFVGPSGCGKSTFAKILKNELGCSDQDFYHYNAASQESRGIGAITTIKEAMQFAPISGNIKIFHCEESHQFTAQAQESLLDITEEPPNGVYFILCTTEPDKFKPTLIRRFHKYEVKPLNTIELNRLLTSTLKKEGIENFPEVVIDKIISVCEGSPGRALNLLDTVIDVPDDDQALRAIEDASVSESNIAEIARVLLSGNGQWSSIAQMINGLSGEPESLRRAFLGYFGKVLLNPKSNHDHVAEMMMCFTEPVFNTGMPGLELAIYFAFKTSA